MQIIQKYNYTELKRQEGEGRLYLTPDGESLPSVTTILNKTKDKAFLKKWRARVGEQKAEKIIADSWRIAKYLEKEYPNSHSLKLENGEVIFIKFWTETN